MQISKEVKVGLFAAVSIAALYLGFNFLKGIDFLSTTKKYYVLYSNVGGLNVSNPVMVNGFTVGRVSSIKLLQGKRNRVLVELDIDGEIILGDSTVALLDSDLLGSKSIVLEVGSLSHPLASGDTLKARLDKGIEAILKESALPVADNLQATIRKINATLDNFAGSSSTIDSLLRKFNRTPDVINGALYDTRRLIRGIDTKTGKLEMEITSTMDSLKIALGYVNDLTRNLKALEIDATLEKANKALEDVSGALSKVGNNEGTIGKLLNSDSVYNNLNSSLENLDKLLIHFDKNPKHFLGPLGQSSKKIARDRKKQAKTDAP